MKKWTYLVAALLLMGTTTTFTGCIDNDEPAGIENLRGAKAELLRAKCAVEAAQAARINAEAEYQKALAAHEQANADFRQAEVEHQKLVNELKSATNDEEKSRIELQIAKNKQAMEQAALEHQAAMVRLQTGLAEANRDYDLALKQIEIAEALMSDKDKLKISDLKAEVVTAKTAVDTKAETVYQAEKTLYEAMLLKAQGGEGTQEDWIPALELKLKRAEAGLVADEEALAKLNDFLTKDVITTDWRKEVKTLEESITALTLEQSNVTVEKTKLTNSDEYKAADAAQTNAKKTLDAIKTSAYKYTYQFKATDYPYGRNEFALNELEIKPGKTDGAEAEVKGELATVKGLLAGYTTEKIAMLDELAKNGTKNLEAAKTKYTKSVETWQAAFDKYDKVGDYDQAKAKKTIAAAGEAYDLAIVAANSDAKKENAARTVYAKALATYYADAEKYVGCVTNEVTLNLTLNNIPVGEEKRTISAWLNDSNLSGVALGAILTANSWGTADFYAVGKAIKTLGDKNTLLTELRDASASAFGFGCLSGENGENGYMRVAPLENEVLAAIKEDNGINNCGLSGDYYGMKQTIASGEPTNYKAVMADFNAAITSLTAKLDAMTLAVAEAKADWEAKKAAFKVFTDKENALTNKEGIVAAKIGAVETVKGALIAAIKDNLGLDGILFGESIKDFEKNLQAGIVKAEDKVIESQKAVAKAKVNLQEAQEGKYDAVADAQLALDKATLALGEAQAEYEKALADLKTGLEIMAGTAE